MDLAYALHHLQFPVHLPALPDLAAEACDALGKAVYVSAMKHLDAEVNASTRLYLLHDRREPLEDEPSKKITTFLRHYLQLVVNARHRKALTRVLVSQHPLAVERMRYKTRAHRVIVPREQRLCRFGCDCVETVEHAMFFCAGPGELVDCRNNFLNVMMPVEPGLISICSWNATNILHLSKGHGMSSCKIYLQGPGDL